MNPARDEVRGVICGVRIEEIADMALFLASQHAAFVTGAILAVDGGSSLAGGRDYSGSLA